jgi:hypothetical protein
MATWVVHCEVNQRDITRSRHKTEDAALKDACSQLRQGHIVHCIVGPHKTIDVQQIKNWCAKQRPV